MYESVKGFSFLVVAYNHEKYIIEHLESIKFLIKSYGSRFKFQIIINDDCSKDRTIYFIDKWLEANCSLFAIVVKLYNKANIGTCASILNMIKHVEGDYLKLTAGDDVYSFENLFLALPFLDKHSIVSGIPLDLTEGLISIKKFDLYNIIASSILYDHKPLINRFVWLSNTNAPNIFYSRKYILSHRVKNFLSKFDVVEDLPIQVAIAENYPESDFYLMSKVFVYYRRTLGSTYIVAGSRFFADQTKLFKHLINNENNIIRVIVLKNRLFCFLTNKKLAKRFFNIAFYVYAISIVKNFFSITKKLGSIDLNVVGHKDHYLIIKDSSESFIRNISHED